MNLRNCLNMLGTTHIEDYFVLSSIHDYPLRVVQLEGYIDAITGLLKESLEHINDENTRLFIRKEILNATVSKKNLGSSFFKEAKMKLGVPPDQMIWPKDFPTVKVLGARETTVEYFAPNRIDFFLNKKREVERLLVNLCNTYNPMMLIAIPTIQMEIATTCTNPEFLELFKGTWTGKEVDMAVFEKIAQKVIKIGLRRFEVEAMHETYRQLLLTGIDLQRALRERLYRYCSKGQGEITLISEYVFLQLFEYLYTIFSIDWIENLMKEFRLPILVLENEYLSAFTPIMSANDALPFHGELHERQHRLLYQYVSSKATNEERIPPFLFFVQSLSKFESEQLRFLVFFLEKSPKKMILFPKAEANRLFNDESEFPETLISEWLDGPKSPFVRVSWKGEDYYLATRIILEDKFFRISWQVHQGKHIRIRGTKFEDFVLDVLQKQFPTSLTAKNKYFSATLNGKKKRYEIDRTFVLNNLFFLIECKNLALIEDTADLRKLRSRCQELQEYGEYLELKANLLKDNYKQLEMRIAQLRQYNCSRIIPLILSFYPDIVSFHKVPFLTIYEFIRYVSLCDQKGNFVSSFDDFSQTKFRFPSYEIRRQD